MIRYLYCAVLALALVSLNGVSAGIRGEKYVALVIGSGDYLGAAALPNAVSDSLAIAHRLKSLGYEVVHLQDPKRGEILKALALLRVAADGAQQVVVYLSGHGFVRSGGAYYVTVDALSGGANEAEHALSLMTFARAFSDRPRRTVIFFDACRTRMARVEIEKTVPTSDWRAGLAVAYASAPGTQAYDGGAGHSPFAQALLRHVTPKAPALPELMRRVRLDVVRQTGGAQVPWLQSSMLQRVFLQVPN